MFVDIEYNFASNEGRLYGNATVFADNVEAAKKLFVSECNGSFKQDLCITDAVECSLRVPRILGYR